MLEARLRYIHVSSKKRKEQLQDDLKSMLEHIDFPTTWEADGKAGKLVTATKQQLWDKFIEIMLSHWEKARQRLRD